MRIARWTHRDRDHDGFVRATDGGDEVVVFPHGATVADALAAGLDEVRAWFAAVADRPGVPLGDVRLRAPLAPATIRDFVAFEEHVEGVSASVDGVGGVVAEWYDAPTFYFTNPHTVRATGDVVDVPVTQRLDFELELAAVIGAVDGCDGRNLTPAQAERRIFGYTVMNDWSARDLQAREMKVRLGPAKGKDFAMTLGPWIVTADELEPFRDPDGFLAVHAAVFVNGRLVGEDLVSNMGWPFGELVAYAARNSVVVAGDVLGSGTVGNGGCLGELWGRGSAIAALEPGDEVRMVVEGVGQISNVVGRRVEAPAIGAARARTRARSR